MDSQEGSKTQEKNKRLLRQRLLESTIAATLFFAFLFLFAGWYSNKYLDKEIGKLEKDLAEFRKTGALQESSFRPLDGNAVWDYQLIEWVLAPRKEWSEKDPEHLPKSHFRMGEHFSVDQLRLMNSFSIDFKPPSAKEFDLLEDRYAELYPIVGRGLQRKDCEWGYPLERLFDSQLNWMAVDSQSMKQFASFMALHSFRKTPEEQLTIALDIIAFGQDYSRHENPTAAFKSAHVKDVGYRLLRHALEAPLSASVLRKALKRLNSIGMIDGLRMLKCLDLGHKAFLTRLRDQQSGSSPNSITKGWIDEKPYGLRSRSTIFLAWEWSYSKALFEEIFEYKALPFSERRRKKEALMRSLHHSRSVFGKIVVPLCLLFLDFDQKPNCKQEMLTILVAAKLYSVEKKAWPQSVEVLRPYMPKGFASDRYADSKEPYKIQEQGSRFVVYSVYEDMIDQEGRQDKRKKKSLWQSGDLALSLAQKALSEKTKQKPKK